MRIGVFGNTNNYPLLLAEALRSRGHDVLLVVDSAEALHRPGSRRPEWASGFPPWIMDGGRFSEWDYISQDPGVTPMLNALAGCDALILNSFGPSFLPLLNRPAISFLTGSDLTHFGNFATLDARTASWSVDHARSAEGRSYVRTLAEFIERQRAGIAFSEAVSYVPPGAAPDGDALLAEIGVEAARRLAMLMADLDHIRFEPAPNHNPLRVFSATRLTWKLPVGPGRSTLDYKGSDVMIRGLGLFKRRVGRSLEIRLVRKGLHVEEAEQLVAAEGLGGDVTWLAEMSLAEVWQEFAQSDIVFDQLGQSMVGMAGVDAMASGRPVIANSEPDVYQAVLGEPLPVCHASTPEHVCRWLERLSEAGERARLGARAHEYAVKYFDPRRAADECVQRLSLAVENRRQAPLGDLLSMTRRLRNAADDRAESLELELEAAVGPLRRLARLFVRILDAVRARVPGHAPPPG